MFLEIVGVFMTFVALVVPAWAEAPLHLVRTPVPEQIFGTASVEVIFGGDMMFDRYIRQVATVQGSDFIFSCVASTLHDADLVVANLEGPITSNSSVSVGTKAPDLNNFTFTFPTTTAALLTRHNIKLVNLGNNHSMNFYFSGLKETKQWLDGGGVGYFGDIPQTSAIYRTSLSGVPLAFISYNEFGGDGAEAAMRRIKDASQEGYLPIVYTHWGEEYVEPLGRVKALGRQFVDAGAEIVIGSHPHIVQEHEIYKGKSIYYSLGNFIFDQYFDEAVRNGLLLQVVFNERGVESIEEVPVYLERDGRTCLRAVE